METFARYRLLPRSLPVFALCTLVAAVVIKTVAPGPIFFQQERVGFMGRRFKLYKFRTMHEGACTSSHQSHFAELVASKRPMQKLDAKGDSRLIPGGWLLRASGLDELPQIINVLRGEMSIVGPRPAFRTSSSSTPAGSASASTPPPA